MNRELAGVTGTGWGLSERPSRIAGAQEAKQLETRKKRWARD